MEETARSAFVWGLPTVALHRCLHEALVRPRPAATSSAAWLDLRSGPVPLRAVPPDGDASVLVLDLYARVVGSVVAATDGPPTGRSVVAGPAWHVTPASDVSAVLRCPTDLCLLLRRHGSRGVVLDRAEHVLLPAPVPPVDVRHPPTTAFLRALDRMLPLMPVLPGDAELRSDLETIGVGVGVGVGVDESALEEALAQDRRDGQLTLGLSQGFDDVRSAVTAGLDRPGTGDEGVLAHAAAVLRALGDEAGTCLRGIDRRGARDS